MRVKILELFIRFLKVVLCEIFHLYFLYISIITEECLPFSFDNKYCFLY